MLNMPPFFQRAKLLISVNTIVSCSLLQSQISSSTYRMQVRLKRASCAMSFISMNLGKRKAKDLEDAPPDWISSKDLMAMPEQQFLDLKAKFENILCRDNECTVTRLNVPKGVYDLRRYHFHTFRRGEASNILAGKNCRSDACSDDRILMILKSQFYRGSISNPTFCGR